MKLEGKTAFITGGNSGIGLATARRFVAEGARVTITGRDQASLDSAVSALGPNVLAIRADTTDVDATERAVAAAVQRFGGLDILFANAGIGGLTPVGATALATLQNILTINLAGPFVTVQAAAPYLNEGASIVLTGSVHAVLGAPGYSAYAASKGGLRSMVRVLAAELSLRGIRVNMVTPGATRTPIWGRGDTPNPNALDQAEPRMVKAVPLGRLSESDEIANAVLFLASSDASNVTATEIVVDGGLIGAPAGAPIYRA